VIMDEPTSALSVRETEMVLDFVERLRKNGLPVIFITHNIYHVYQVADRFTILDRGEKTGDFAKKDVNAEDIIEVIRMGRAPERLQGKRTDLRPAEAAMS
jgi:simple sugar transport system ATP-binding protein